MHACKQVVNILVGRKHSDGLFYSLIPHQCAAVVGGYVNCGYSQWNITQIRSLHCNKHGWLSLQRFDVVIIPAHKLTRCIRIMIV